MHLLRVQVPEFRTLKNVDIEFEKGFIRKVFPLGSQNGGGKSTLLQLIFVLLQCSAHLDRMPFLENLLALVSIPEGESHKVLAKMDIWDGKKVVQIEFLYSNDTVIESSKSNDTMAKLLPIISYLNAGKQSLLCRMTGIAAGETPSFLHNLADHIFLVAPSTQVHLFLSSNDKKLLFKTETEDSSYEKAIKQSRTKLPGFFTYDIISTEVITESFKVARDQDFAEAVNTGQYGNHYQTILKEMNKVLATGKQILPQLRPIGVNLYQKEDGVEGIRFQTEEGIELYPEDLSHGELKRLSIYVWLKHRQIADAIVLMDEVENALHPDWQYQIVLDLMEWGPTNQYILATHSYELCRALTPAHVKDLEPKLLPARLGYEFSN